MRCPHFGDELSAKADPGAYLTELCGSRQAADALLEYIFTGKCLFALSSKSNVETQAVLELIRVAAVKCMVELLKHVVVFALTRALRVDTVTQLLHTLS